MAWYDRSCSVPDCNYSLSLPPWHGSSISIWTVFSSKTETINSRYQLRSSQSNQLIVPPVKFSTYGPRSFAVAGPTIWNNLPEYPRDPELSIDNFRRQLKTFLFAQYWIWHPSALETLVPVRSINLLFTLHIYIFTLEVLNVTQCTINRAFSRHVLIQTHFFGWQGNFLKGEEQGHTFELGYLLTLLGISL